jgi:hypothetical protein
MTLGWALTNELVEDERAAMRRLNSEGPQEAANAELNQRINLALSGIREQGRPVSATALLAVENEVSARIRKAFRDYHYPPSKDERIRKIAERDPYFLFDLGWQKEILKMSGLKEDERMDYKKLFEVTFIGNFAADEDDVDTHVLSSTKDIACCREVMIATAAMQLQAKFPDATITRVVVQELG